MIPRVFRRLGTDYSVNILNEIGSHKVLMYSKSYCPFCNNAKKLFKLLEVSPHFIELDLVKDGGEISEALEKMTKQRTVPNIFIAGTQIGGYNDLIDGLSKNKVQDLLNQANVSFKPLT